MIYGFTRSICQLVAFSSWPGNCLEPTRRFPPQNMQPSTAACNPLQPPDPFPTDQRGQEGLNAAARHSHRTATQPPDLALRPPGQIGVLRIELEQPFLPAVGADPPDALAVLAFQHGLAAGFGGPIGGLHRGPACRPRQGPDASFTIGINRSLGEPNSRLRNLETNDPTIGGRGGMCRYGTSPK